ncbi:non-ribosomal peptide synthetase/MFS transporter [Streptosporangium sp. 'caverna']|uniref:non-ribosomal peptide synthetase/MFS transporter n=1 Tax=Streptosporangium sp. 'caverna' TaxID=2202249 RepID=UPI001EF94987|nr:non-ribosomal peptide synthetase/MFS transporter [Streptosporangium sp. 'caverna']
MLSPAKQALLAQRLRRGAAVAPPSISPRPPETEILPLSSGQERIWFLGQLDPEDTSFAMSLAQRWRGPLDVAVLRRAFDEIVARHEMLRTRFRGMDDAVGTGNAAGTDDPADAVDTDTAVGMNDPVDAADPDTAVGMDNLADAADTDNAADPADAADVDRTVGIDDPAGAADMDNANMDAGPVQVVEEPGPAPFECLDVSEDEAPAVIAERVSTPFDLTAGPPLRITLLRLGDDDHVLSVVCHHIIADGVSINLLLRELAVLYGAFLAGEPSPLGPLPIQYADYTIWQRGELQGESARRSLDYWSEQLAGAPILELPTDRPRPAVHTSEGDTLTGGVDAEVTARLERLAIAEGGTLFMALLAAYQTLLMRHTGQQDICVGSPIGGRPHVELEPLIGYFLNTLVLRGDLSGDPTFRELLGRTRSTAVDAFSHQEIPFERVMTDLRIERDLSRSPLFQTMLILHSQNDPDQVLPMRDIEVEGFDTGYRAAKFEVTLEAWRGADGLTLGFGYRTDLFDRSTVEALADRFVRLLRAVADDPDIRLSEIDLLGEDERERILGWSTGPGRLQRETIPGLQEKTAPELQQKIAPELQRETVPGLQRETAPELQRETAPELQRETVPELIAAATAAAPGRTALSHEGVELTYAELDGRSDRLARALREAGAGPESIVGVCLDRSPDLIVTLLAVWKAGAAYLPLDPAYPDDRLTYMLADSAAGILVAPAATGARLPEIRRLDPSDEPRESAAELPASAPDRAAYVIYTSGSTGRPKGVVVTHRALAARVGWMREEYGLSPADRVLQFASVSFDTHAEEVYPCLAAGAALTLLPGGGEFLPDFLASAEGARLTVLDLPTPYWHELVADIDAVAWPPGLRLTVLGADQAQPQAVRAWHRRFGGRVRLVNTYGPTEATIIATCAELRDSDERPPIGRPIAETSVYVLDERRGLVPAGTPGELYIGGAGLARGYLNRPELTAERFVTDPYGEGLLYRTGDRARWRPDGQLEFLGRLDSQVKLRGYRIELGEIEARLLEAPGVAQAVVVVDDGALVAYVVRDAEHAGTDEHRELDERAGPDGLNEHRELGKRRGFDESRELGENGESHRSREPREPLELREWLASAVPAYMVPKAVVLLDRLPLTPNGKLDTRALPAPRMARDESAAVPVTPVERVIAGIWSQVLGIAEIGAEDDFFELGGHSLSATKAIARMRRELGGGVSLMDLFQHPTVRGLAALVERPGGASGGEPDGASARPLLHELTPVQRPGTEVVTYVCVPYGGGSAVVYRPLADALPPSHRLLSLAIPGNDLGLEEDALPFEELAELCTEEILRRVRGPLVLYGQSSVGSALTVEIARRVEAAGRELEAVFIGAAFPFSRPTGRVMRGLARLARAAAVSSDRAYGNWLASMGVDLSDLEPEHAVRIVRNMRREAERAEEYFTGILGADVTRLRAPLVTVAGDRDPATEFHEERYREWHFLADTSALVVMSEAGHFFLKYRAAELARILVETPRALPSWTPEIPAGSEGLKVPETTVSRAALDDPGDFESSAGGSKVPESTVSQAALGSSGSLAPRATSGNSVAPEAARPRSALDDPGDFASSAGGSTPLETQGTSGIPARSEGATWWLAGVSRYGQRDPAASRAPEPGMGRFAAVAAGQLVSIIGSSLTEFAVPIWIYQTTGSVASFALFAVLALVPGLLVAPFAGAIVDRMDRRRVMLAGDIGAAGSQLVLGVLLWTGNLEVWHVYLPLVMLSVALTFQRLAYGSAVAQLVPKRFLGHANGVVQMVNSSSQLLVPLIAVGLMATIGLEGIVLFDVASYGIAIGTLLLVRFPVTMAWRRRETLLAEIAEGFRYSWGNPGFRAMLFFFAGLNVFLSPLFLMVTPLVLSFATLDDTGRVAFASGAAGFLGGLIMSLWGGPRRLRMRGVLLCTLALGACSAVTGLRADLVVITVGAFGMALCLTLLNGIYATIVQVKVPQRFHGRVFALNTVISWSTLPIGFGLVAPGVSALLEPMLADGGTLASTAGALVGTGPGRGIGFMYVLFAMGIVGTALIALRTRSLSGFDRDIPDAIADDLVGVEAIAGRTPRPAEKNVIEDTQRVTVDVAKEKI